MNAKLRAVSRVLIVGIMLAAAEAAGSFLPGPHTSRFEPSPEPTLRTGIKAMTSVAIALLRPTT